MDTLGIGIIGLHHLHPVDYLPHVAAIPGAEVRMLAEPDAAYLDRISADSGIPGTQNIDELLARDDIGAVIIFLPHAECADAVEKAAAAGKHVIVEKPMAATSDQIRRMIRATSEAGVALSPPYCWRCHPAARKIKQLIDQGALGKIVALEGRCAAGYPQRYLVDGISPWILEKKTAGGGPMHNLGVHWIDLFRSYLGDEVESAVGTLSHEQHGLDVEDNSFAILKFAGGAVATIDISYSVPPGYPAGRDLFIAIRGTHGALSWSPAWGGTADEIAFASRQPGYEDAPVTNIHVGSNTVPGYGGVCGLIYLRETIQAIQAGNAPAITGTDGLRAMEVVEAVYESAESGQRVNVRQTDTRG